MCEPTKAHELTLEKIAAGVEVFLEWEASESYRIDELVVALHRALSVPDSHRGIAFRPSGSKSP